jgi:hypothetical protein
MLCYRRLKINSNTHNKTDIYGLIQRPKLFQYFTLKYLSCLSRVKPDFAFLKDYRSFNNFQDFNVCKR